MPPYTEAASARVSRRKGFGGNDRATNSESNSHGGDDCHDPGYSYDTEAGGEHEAAIHGVACCWDMPLLNSYLHSAIAGLFRASQIIRGSRLSYREARRARRSVISMLILITIYALKTFYVALLTQTFSASLRPSNDQQLENLPVLIKRFDFSTVNDMGGWIYRPRPFPTLQTFDKLSIQDINPDYGGLEFTSLAGVPMESFRRSIDLQDDLRYEAERDSQLVQIESSARNYWNYHQDDLEFDEKISCRKPNWKADYYPNCNSFHEVDLSRSYSERFASSRADREYDSHSFR